MKKSLAGILLLMILLSSISFYPRKVEATGFPVIDVVAIGTAIYNFTKIAGETILNIAVASFRKMILDMIVDEMVAYISGEGTSAFDTGDWGQFFDEAAQRAGGKALEEITGPEVMAQLCDENWAGQINFILQPTKKFAKKARCTLEDINVNYNDFIENFENGGWAAWIKISESQSNPYSYFLSAMDEKLAKETQKRLSSEKELTASGGFLSDNVCVQEICTMLIINDLCSNDYYIKDDVCKKEISHNADENIKEDQIADNCKCIKFETRTPGKIIADSTSKSIGRDFDWLVSNEEWESYVATIGNAIVNRLTKEGVKAIKSSVPQGSPSSRGLAASADNTAPLTSAKIIDPWRVKLTANEPAKTYYSLDGSKPSSYRSFEYKGESLTFVSSTAIDAPTAQLKWMSVDDNFNKEDSRSLPAFLRSPFNYKDLITYIDSQDTSIPDEITNALKKFFGDEENKNEAEEISEKTSIPADLQLKLNNYLKIEDLRIKLGKTTVLSSGQRKKLDDILATYEDSDQTNDGKLTDLISILTEIQKSGISAFDIIQTDAEEIRDRRKNLQTVLSYLNETIASLDKYSEEQDKAVPEEGETPEEFAIRTAIELDDCQTDVEKTKFPVNLSCLSSALATDHLFSELKEKTDKVILERSLFTIDETGDWINPAAALAPADSEHVVILSANPKDSLPTASFFKQITWDDKPGARDIAWSEASNKKINGFYYKQAFIIPAADIPFGTTIWYGAIDSLGKTIGKNEKGVEFNASFGGLPPVTDFVKPIAEIKLPEKDSEGYFILNPSTSVDNDITPLISGYEWDFINESSATATPRYNWEAFDLNRDGSFEEMQCLYKVLKEGETVTEIKYYDAARSSPYNDAPNTTRLNLDLPKTCEKTDSTIKIYYLEETDITGKSSKDPITLDTYELLKKSWGGLTEFGSKKIYSEESSVSTGAFEKMEIVDANNGIIKVKFAVKSGPITISLRVTDDEGLTATASTIINP